MAYTPSYVPARYVHPNLLFLIWFCWVFYFRSFLATTVADELINIPAKNHMNLNNKAWNVSYKQRQWHWHSCQLLSNSRRFSRQFVALNLLPSVCSYNRMEGSTVKSQYVYAPILVFIMVWNMCIFWFQFGKQHKLRNWVFCSHTRNESNNWIQCRMLEHQIYFWISGHWAACLCDVFPTCLLAVCWSSLFGLTLLFWFL